MSLANDNSGELSKRILIIPAVMALLVVADQVTKRWIESNFVLGESQPVIPGFFDLVYIENTGSAFGLMSSIDSIWLQRGLTAFTIIALIVIFSLYRSMTADEWLGKASLVMIGSGALGNLVDRIRHGAVTDFLLFYIGRYRWPAFNLADSLITVGVTILAVVIIFQIGAAKKDPVD